MKILIVDDNSDNLYLLEKFLQASGYETVPAANGNEALAMALKDPPDMIISDILMPVMDGFSLCHQCKRNKTLKKIPFMFYSATYTDPKDKELAYSLGADRFIVKPQGLYDFLEIVKETFDTFKAEKEHPISLPEPKEEVFLKEYNESLIRKLEEKMTQLELAENELRKKNAELENDIEERKRAEEKLALINHTLKSLSECISITDTHNNILFLNQAFLDTYGYSENDLIGKSIDVVSVDVLLNKNIILPETLVGGWRGELLNRKKDGTTFPVSLSTSVVYDEKKQPIALVGVANDITERKKIEIQLRQSEERFRTLFMSMSDGFYLSEVIYDDNGNPCDYRYLEANPAFERIMGLNHDQIVGKRYKELVPVDTTHWLDTYFKVARTGLPLTYEFYSDEYQKYFDTYAFQAVKGQVTVFVRDVTERKRMEEELRASEQKFSAVFEQAPIAYELYDQNGLLVQANAAFERLWQGPRSLAIGQYNVIKDPQVKARGLLQYVERAYAGEIISNLTYEFDAAAEELARGMGRKRLITSTFYPITNHKGQITNIVIVHEDITERTKAESALKESEEQYRNLFENMHSGSILLEVICDGEGNPIDHRLLQANAEFEKQTGLKRDEEIGKTSAELSFKWPEDVARRYYDIAINGGNIQSERFNESLQRHYDIRVFSPRKGQFALLFNDITERKRNEEARLRSEQRLTTFLNTTSDMAFLKDAQFRHLFANGCLAEFFNRPVEEILGKTDYELMPIEGAEKCRKSDEIALTEQRAITTEESIGEQYFETVKFPVMLEDGQIGIGGFIRDITERKRAEGALREREEFLSSIIENIPDMIFIKDARELRFVRFNKAGEKLLGHTKDELIGKNDYDLFPEEQADFFTKKDAEVLNSGQPYDIPEEPIDTKAGTRIVHTKKIPIPDQNGKPAYLLGISEDITERKLAEELLNASEVKYRRLFEAARDGILILDAETGKVVDVNPFLIEKLGFSHEAFLGKKVWELGFFKDILANQASFAELREKEYARYENLPLETADGKRFEVEFISNVYKVNHHKVIQCNIRDITERKRAEETLRESEERFKELFNDAPIGYHEVDAQGHITRVNRTELEMLGYSKEEMIGQCVWKFIDDDEEARQRVLCKLSGTLPSDKGKERGYRRKDGTIVPVLVEDKFLRSSDGRISGIRTTLQDITERKRAENELMQSEHRKTIINRIASVFLTTPDEETYGEVLNVALQAMKSKYGIFGFIAENGDLIIPSLTRDVWNQCRVADKSIVFPPTAWGKSIWGKTIREKKTFLSDGPFHTPEGHIHINHFLSVPILYGNETIGLFSVANNESGYTKEDEELLEDIANFISPILNARLQRDQLELERKQAEEKLRRSEEQFRLISENVADLIAVLDIEGRRVYNSPSYKNILGDPASLRGTDSFHNIHPDDRERIKHLFNETVRTGIGQRAEYRFVLQDGTVRNVASQGSVIKGPDGKVSQVLVVSRDVTEEKRLEQQFLRSQRMESIGTLAGGVAHDLNNVLAPIMLSIEILKTRNPDPTTKQIIETIESSAQRGSDIVRQVLTFSRGAGDERILLQPRHLINEVVKIAKETFPKSIEIRTNSPRNLWTLMADPTQIHQILLNVCVNARDAMPNGGKLTIEAENFTADEQFASMNLDAKPGQYIVIAITDTGIGMSAEIVNKIFEPFFTTKEVGKGTGLGLSTTHAIVKKHGGFIHVYSEIGKGSTFKIYLPASIKGEVSANEAARAELPVGHGETILVVDDEASVREMSRGTLESYGYKVLTASNGTEALSLYAEKKKEITLVLTDMMMPIMGGFVTIEVLKKMNPNVLVVPTSGLPSEIETVKSLIPDLKYYLMKPYTAEKLLETLHRAITDRKK